MLTLRTTINRHTLLGKGPRGQAGSNDDGVVATGQWPTPERGRGAAHANPAGRQPEPSQTQPASKEAGPRLA